MSFWGFCSEHPIVALILGFLALVILDQMQANLFATIQTRRGRK